MKLIFIFILTSLNAFGQSCPQTNIEPSHIKDLTYEVMDKYYPELKNVNLKFRAFKSKEYFFQTNINTLFMFNSKENRKYFIEYNASLIFCAPSDKALKAILLHELEHIADYEKLNNIELLRLFSNLLDVNFRQQFERDTDKAVIDEKQTQGLLDFRLWLSERLSSKAQEKKDFFYFSVSELESILELQNQN